jgi:putative ABC transport system permease protein
MSKKLNNIKPSNLALKFFRWFCRADYVEDIEGDLLERFEKRNQEGKAATRLLVLDVLKLLRPSIIKKLSGTQKLNNYGMFKNYFKVSYRNILRHKTFSFLNITGLSIGISCCVLILIYVKNELSYDQYHENYANTYRVLHYYGNTGDEIDNSSLSPDEYQVWGNAPISSAIKNYFPQIINVFRFTAPNSFLLEYEGRRFQEDNIVYADSTAFDVFSWNLIAGDPKTALINPNSIVLTKKLSDKYFGDLNPIGQTLKVGQNGAYKVTGVMEEVPTNSHFTFDALISMTTFINNRAHIFDMWGYVDFYTYFTVHPSSDIKTFHEQIPNFIDANYPKENGGKYSILFEPLSDAYLYSEAGRKPGLTGSITNIYIFSSVAIFILLIACINFMNLSTARSVERAKEVAIRKTIGSHRSSIISQFLIEAVLLTFLSTILAAGLIVLAHPYLELLSGKDLKIDWVFTYENLFITLAAALSIGVLAGSYPAFILSNFKPVKVLRGSFKTSTSGILLRKSLVVLQFSLSIILLVGTVVVYSQLNHLRNYDLGFTSERMLIVDFGWDGKVQQQMKYIKSELLSHKDVTSIAASRATPGEFFPNAGTNIENPSGEMENHGPAIYEIDDDFISTYDIELVAGRSYSKDFPTDTVKSMILNESAAKLWGYADPADVIGKRFSQWGREGKVIGVVKNFNYVSLHSKVEPLTLRHSSKWNNTKLSLKLRTKNLSATIEEIEEQWAQLVPHRPFQYHFLDSKFNVQYEADDRFGAVFSVFSGLAIFVACLGLFGLTIYSTSQRTKEIGIRKVLGASLGQIMSILSLDFIKLFLFSLVISIPLSWYVMNNWLDDFAYKINLGWEVFFIATFITFLISFATMSIKTIGAAISNPIEALRNE